MYRITTLVAGLALSVSAFALSLADLTQSDASAGLKDALSQGAKVAVLVGLVCVPSTNCRAQTGWLGAVSGSRPGHAATCTSTPCAMSA